MTVGTLDLGGASSQISFFKSDQVTLEERKATRLRCRGKSRCDWTGHRPAFLRASIKKSLI